MHGQQNIKKTMKNIQYTVYGGVTEYLISN